MLVYNKHLALCLFYDINNHAMNVHLSGSDLKCCVYIAKTVHQMERVKFSQCRCVLWDATLHKVLATQRRIPEDGCLQFVKYLDLARHAVS